MMTTETKLAPQTVAASIRRLLASSDWAWRFSNYTGDGEPATLRAVEILRHDANKARAWLTTVASKTKQSLPIGNGTNGPWNVVACVTPSGRYGVVDIASGVAVEYDAVAPDYVCRFAVAADKGQSPHDAGGNGGKPMGWRQVALMFGSHEAAKCRTPETVSPVAVTWGLQTCYGSIGADPDLWPKYPTLYGIWSDMDAAGVPVAETADSQWEEIPLGCGVDPERWDRYVKSLRWDFLPRGVTTRHGGGNWTIGGVKLHYVYVRGQRPQREAAIAALRSGWETFVAAEAVEAVKKLYKCSGLKMPSKEVQ